MSNTLHIESLLSGYLDDQLSAAEKQQVEHHLRGCGTCEQHRQDLLKVRALLKESPVLTPPESFYTAVHRRIDQKQAAASLWVQPWKIWASVAAVLMVGVITWQVDQENMHPQPVMSEISPSAHQDLIVSVQKPEMPELKKMKPQKQPLAKSDDLQERDNAKEIVPEQRLDEGAEFAKAKRQTDSLGSVEIRGVARNLAVAPARNAESLPHSVAQSTIIRTARVFETLWQSYYPEASVPAVNFDQFIVVAVTDGKILRIETLADRVQVYYHPTTNVPFHYQTLPKTQLPIQFLAQ